MSVIVSQALALALMSMLALTTVSGTCMAPTGVKHLHSTLQTYNLFEDALVGELTSAAAS